MPERLRRWRSWGLALVVCLAAAEVASRLDDWLFSDVPLLANPNRERDLVVHDSRGVRGRPHGVYKKWRLNAFGFRGPEISERPTGRRLMVLGASETFGLYEGAGHEYPAALASELHKHGYADVEVVNAAVAGMALPSLTDYWEKWASRFEPEIVFVYPSPHFYLDDEAPKPVAPRESDETQPTRLRSRFAERMIDTAKQTPLLKSLRARYALERTIADKGDDYLYREVPADRLRQFTEDLERLADAIQRRGAVPVLVTHAFKSPSPPQVSDMAELDYLRIFVPRATAASLPAFDHAARDATLALAQRRGWAAIDAAAVLGGHREWFGDTVHFNDRGSQEMASLLAREVPALLCRTGKR